MSILSIHIVDELYYFSKSWISQLLTHSVIRFRRLFFVPKHRLLWQVNSPRGAIHRSIIIDYEIELVKRCTTRSRDLKLAERMRKAVVSLVFTTLLLSPFIWDNCNVNVFLQFLIQFPFIDTRVGRNKIKKHVGIQETRICKSREIAATSRFNRIKRFFSPSRITRDSQRDAFNRWYGSSSNVLVPFETSARLRYESSMNKVWWEQILHESREDGSWWMKNMLGATKTLEYFPIHDPSNHEEFSAFPSFE